MPARVRTELPADSLRALAGSLEDGEDQAPGAALAVSAVRNLVRYAPAGKRVRLWIEWESEADATRTPAGPAWFVYDGEEVGEAFTEWCAAERIEARDDEEYRWLRQAFTAGMNAVAQYPELLDGGAGVAAAPAGPLTVHGLSGERVTAEPDEDGVDLRTSFPRMKLSPGSARDLAACLIACARAGDEWMAVAEADSREPGPEPEPEDDSPFADRHHDPDAAWAAGDDQAYGPDGPR